MAKTKAHIEAEAKMPPELRATFNEIVQDYKNAAESRTGQIWVNYNILGDLVRDGWRKVA